MKPEISAKNRSRATVPSSSSRWLAAGGIVLAVLLAYGGTVRSPFLFDDTVAVLNNSTIRHLFSPAIFSPPADGSTTMGRPLVNVSFALNYAVSGEAVWSYHALNILIHAGSALLLMGIVRRTLLAVPAPPRVQAGAPGLAFVTALLWAIHPLQTESVTCIAQRTESLCGFFYLLTFYAFVRAAAESESAGARGRKMWPAAAVAAAFLGMATKEVMVTAPLMVLLFDRTFFAGSFSAALRLRRIFYAALGSSWLFLAFLLARTGGSRGSAAGFGMGVSTWSYLLKQCEAVVLYLKLCVWPHPLVLDYGTALTHSLADVGWQSLVVVSLLVATGWALVKKPVVGFFGAWFFVILSPSSSVVPLIAQTIAEHRMYLPLAAVIALSAGSLFWRFGPRTIWLGAGCAAVFLAMTIARNRDYRDVAVIWQDNVDQRPEVSRGHNNLAWALQQQGKSADADRHFARAIALQPDYIAAHYSWGVALLDQKRLPEAIAQFEAAVKLAPAHVDAYVNLGNALMQAQRAAEAVPVYETALRLRDGADVRYDLGVALNDLGRHDEARHHLDAALAQNPNLPDAHYQIARAAEADGRSAEAESHYLAALRLAPSHLVAHRKLGLLLARAERWEPAAEQFQAVLRQEPRDADAHANLGNVFLLQGRARDATAQYEEALRLRPDDPRTRENLQLARESLR